MSSKLIYLAAVIVIIASSQAAFADVKIKSKQTMSGQTYENTTYIKGKRQRTEMMNGMMVNITQCDLRRGIQVNPNTKTYMVNPFTVSTETTTKAAPASVDKNGVVQAGGTVTTTVTIKDTGERKQMFGYTARHLIITMETSSSPDACSKAKYKMETDGWYIDFEQQFDCGDAAAYSGYKGSAKPTCQDKYSMKTIGTAKRGYPVYEKMTMFDENGKETTSFVNEVVELSKATLDTSLFDVPEGFREVSDPAQMYASAPSSDPVNAGSTPSSSLGRTSSAVTMPSGMNSGSPTTVLNNAANAAPAAATAPVGDKKSGTIRIGLAAVKTGSVGKDITAADLAAAVQNTFANYLKVPNVEVVVLEARLASAIQSEAAEKECDYVLHATVSHKKGGGGFGMFKAVAPVLSSVVPMAGMAGVAGAVAGTVASTAIMTAANVSGNVKSKDEITLDVKLVNASGAPALEKVVKAKAKSDGEDIISNVIEQAAQAIVDTIGK